MPDFLLTALSLTAALPTDVAPPEPLEGAADWVVPALVAFGVVLAVAVAVVVTVIRRRR